MSQKRLRVKSDCCAVLRDRKGYTHHNTQKPDHRVPYITINKILWVSNEVYLESVGFEKAESDKANSTKPHAVVAVSLGALPDAQPQRCECHQSP
jgi:hypothetical protein